MALRVVFWLVFALAMAVYVVMVAWSLPTVSAAAGGLAPFDLRPGGYTFEEAREFLRALSPAGKAHYLYVQHPLDYVYPPLITATLYLGIALLTPDAAGRWRWVIGVVALPIVAFDYLENLAVARLLQLGADRATPTAVATASRWTLLKSGFSTVAMTLLLALLIAWVVRSLRAKRSAG